MDEDIKLLGRHLTKKIDEAKEEIIEYIDSLFGDEGEEIDSEEESNPFDDDNDEELDFDSETEEETEEEKPKEDKGYEGKRKLKIEEVEEEKPKKKRGLFGKKK